MKLTMNVYKSEPRTEKIRLKPELVDLFDAYLEFYQKDMGLKVTSEAIILEILFKFMKSDRDFIRWFRKKSGDSL